MEKELTNRIGPLTELYKCFFSDISERFLTSNFCVDTRIKRDKRGDKREQMVIGIV